VNGYLPVRPIDRRPASRSRPEVQAGLISVDGRGRIGLLRRRVTIAHSTLQGARRFRVQCAGACHRPLQEPHQRPHPSPTASGNEPVKTIDAFTAAGGAERSTMLAGPIPGPRGKFDASLAHDTRTTVKGADRPRRRKFYFWFSGRGERPARRMGRDSAGTFGLVGPPHRPTVSTGVSRGTGPGPGTPAWRLGDSDDRRPAAPPPSRFQKRNLMARMTRTRPGRGFAPSVFFPSGSGPRTSTPRRAGTIALKRDRGSPT